MGRAHSTDGTRIRQGLGKGLNGSWLVLGSGSMPLTRSGPVAKRRLYQRQGRDAGGVRSQDPRPEAEPQRMRLAQQRFALLLGKAAFGSDQHVDAGLGFG